LERFDVLCPCHAFGEDKSLVYDARLEDLARASSSSAAVGKSIVVGKFFQSLKYTRAIDRRLRSYLSFQPDLRQYVETFFKDNVPPAWNRAFVRVGIHVRRGDVLTKDTIEFGYTTPDVGYFHRAMEYFAAYYERVHQFLVCTQDVDWARTNLAGVAPSRNASLVNATIVRSRTSRQDMALLAACGHTIMLTCTYRWWAAWLAKGTTIYYAGWPRNGTSLWNMFRRQDFFPPSWTGMT
jgi:galactoside 2-L-fucosyltransferase 1/2